MRKLVLYNRLLIFAFVMGSCANSYTVSEIKYQNNTVSQELAADDQRVVAVYEPYKEKLDKDMSRVISISDETLEKSKPESKLTNFLADLLLEQGNYYLREKNLKTDVSYFNYGGIRTFIPRGEVKVRNIFELMPFENEMVFLKLKGTDLKLFLDEIARGGGDSVGGVSFTISEGKASNIKTGDLPLSEVKEYWLVTNDYVAGGGDGMEMLHNATETIASGKLIRDVIIAHLEGLYSNGMAISPKLDGRIKTETGR